MIAIKETTAHIKQMKEDFQITEVKKSTIVDFVTDVSCGYKIIFTTTGKYNVDDRVVMRFINMDDFNEALSRVIEITDKIGV